MLKLVRINRFLTRIMFTSACAVWLSMSAAAEFKIAHCSSGCPAGNNTENPLIMRAIYTLSFNEATKVADWVAYSVSADSIGVASSLSRAAIPDDIGLDLLSESDFVDSQQSDLIMGHLVPLVNFAGSPFWQDTNYLTARMAITPNLNRGAWYGLNWSIRNLVNREREVFVVAGPIYYEDAEISGLQTEKKHRIPDAYFKVIRTESNLLSAFILKQNTPVHVHHCSLTANLNEIEELTGLALFPSDDRSNFGSLDARLGCSSGL